MPHCSEVVIRGNAVEETSWAQTQFLFLIIMVGGISCVLYTIGTKFEIVYDIISFNCKVTMAYWKTSIEMYK